MSQPSYSLRVAEVTKRYGDHVAVSELSFEVKSGVIYGVLGPNGAGKSTTLRMITDILAPDHGDIRLLGGLRPGRDAARHIGYLPEERGLYPKMGVLESLIFFAQLRGVSGRDARRRGMAWLERLELASWKNNKVQELSKGMQQKVQFATALLHEPALLILDEPWSGLDPINADVLRDIVLEQKAAGRTILFSTHLMEQAEKLCDSVCIIARGHKVLDGELAGIKRDAASGRVAIGFGDHAARDRAEAGILADASRVASQTRQSDRVEVELAAGITPEELLAALVGAGLGVRHFEVVEPSLHQIFVTQTQALES
jgi:ABC-2 type transport system ATP-binding protein